MRNSTRWDKRFRISKSVWKLTDNILRRNDWSSWASWSAWLPVWLPHPLHKGSQQTLHHSQRRYVQTQLLPQSRYRKTETSMSLPLLSTKSRNNAWEGAPMQMTTCANPNESSLTMDPAQTEVGSRNWVFPRPDHQSDSSFFGVSSLSTTSSSTMEFEGRCRWRRPQSWIKKATYYPIAARFISVF